MAIISKLKERWEAKREYRSQQHNSTSQTDSLCSNDYPVHNRRSNNTRTVHSILLYSFIYMRYASFDRRKYWMHWLRIEDSMI